MLRCQNARLHCGLQAMSGKDISRSVLVNVTHARIDITKKELPINMVIASEMKVIEIFLG